MNDTVLLYLNSLAMGESDRPEVVFRCCSETRIGCKTHVQTPRLARFAEHTTK